MSKSYNSIAGHSLSRLAGLSDGVFSIAMTLLVLDLRAPAVELIHSEQDLWRAFVALAPRLLVYVMTFLTLGIYWIGQQTQLNHLERSERGLTWIHIMFLFAVSLTPFSTAMLSQFIEYRVALLAYWANIVLLGATLYFSWLCAVSGGLVKADAPAHVSNAIVSRIVTGQGLYALGALLCAFSTYWSIGFMILVQLNYAIAPRVPGRTRD